jgi:hypothetical protein
VPVLFGVLAQGGNLRNEFAGKRLCIFNCKLVSITVKNLQIRLKKNRPNKKDRACEKSTFKINRMRFLSLHRRELILEMTKVQALKMRLAAIEQKIEKLGGKKGKGAWPVKNITKVKTLYALKFKAKEELRELKKDAQEKNLYNCNPHYVAKILKIDVVLVYKTMRQFAFTGKILFKRDQRSSLPNTAKRERLATTALESQRNLLKTAVTPDQLTCKEHSPLVLSQGASPLGESPMPGIRSNSPRKLIAVLDPEQSIFDSLTSLCNPAFGRSRAKDHPFVKEFKELELTVSGGRYSDCRADIVKLADYYRVEAGDDDCPPATAKLKLQTKGTNRRFTGWKEPTGFSRSKKDREPSVLVQQMLSNLSLYRRTV